MSPRPLMPPLSSETGCPPGGANVVDITVPRSENLFPVVRGLEPADDLPARVDLERVSLDGAWDLDAGEIARVQEKPTKGPAAWSEGAIASNDVAALVDAQSGFVKTDAGGSNELPRRPSETNPCRTAGALA